MGQGNIGAFTGKVVQFEFFYPNEPDAVVELLSISPDAVEVFDYSIDAWDKPHDQWLRMLYPGDYALAVSASWATARTGDPLSVEYRMVRADGTILWIRDEETVERRGDGEIWRGTFTVIDPPAVPGWTPVALGTRILSLLGSDAAGELLGALGGSPAERASMIEALAGRKDAAWLVDLIVDLELEPPARSRVADGLRRALRGG